MIEIKRVEIRDRGTFIPALALGITGGKSEPLLERAGFGNDRLIFLIHLERQECTWDPYGWNSSRTMRVAHDWLQFNWEQHKDGGVVDVEFILNETPIKKESMI